MSIILSITTLAFGLYSSIAFFIFNLVSVHAQYTGIAIEIVKATSLIGVIYSMLCLFKPRSSAFAFALIVLSVIGLNFYIYIFNTPMQDPLHSLPAESWNMDRRIEFFMDRTVVSSAFFAATAVLCYVLTRLRLDR